MPELDDSANLTHAYEAAKVGFMGTIKSTKPTRRRRQSRSYDRAANSTNGHRRLPLSSYRVAKLAGFTTASHLNRLLRGEVDATFTTALVICAAAGVTLDELADLVLQNDSAPLVIETRAKVEQARRRADDWAKSL